MTPSHPCIPACTDARSRTSPRTRSTGKSSMRSVRLLWRSRQRTLCPLCTSVRTTAEPVKPLPPVTKTCIVSFSHSEHQLLALSENAHKVVKKCRATVDGQHLTAYAVQPAAAQGNDDIGHLFCFDVMLFPD